MAIPSKPFARDLEDDGIAPRPGSASPFASKGGAAPIPDGDFFLEGPFGKGEDRFAKPRQPLGRTDDPFGKPDDPFAEPGGWGPAASKPASSIFEEDFRATPERRGPPLAFGSGLVSQTDAAVERAFDLAALNPLVGIASPLLWLAARLNESMPPDDVPHFRQAVLEEIRRFDNNVMARGIPQRSARVARYALAATIDDIILNTEWGGQSDWPAQGLVSTLYQETWGGERFFDLLGQLYFNPEENIDTLELMAICLSIGFLGKYRVMEGGSGQLTRLRGELYRTIRRVRGPYERDLSAGWVGAAAPYRAPARVGWFWMLAALALLLLLVFYLTLGFLLSRKVDATVDEIARLVPAAPITVEAPAIPTIPAPVPPPPPAPAPTQVQRITSALSDDVAAGRVEVAGNDRTVTVRLPGTSFPSGGASLADTVTPVVQRIAAALDKEKGEITVVGYTDNVPIAGSSLTRNNTTLSRDRAAAAAGVLKRFILDPGRVTFEGRGDADPIAPNDTAEGRARNRRVEFQIPAESSLR